MGFPVTVTLLAAKTRTTCATGAPSPPRARTNLVPGETHGPFYSAINPPYIYYFSKSHSFPDDVLVPLPLVYIETVPNKLFLFLLRGKMYELFYLLMRILHPWHYINCFFIISLNLTVPRPSFPALLYIHLPHFILVIDPHTMTINSFQFHSQEQSINR